MNQGCFRPKSDATLIPKCKFPSKMCPGGAMQDRQDPTDISVWGIQKAAPCDIFMQYVSKLLRSADSTSVSFIGFSISVAVFAALRWLMCAACQWPDNAHLFNWSVGVMVFSRPHSLMCPCFRDTYATYILTFRHVQRVGYRTGFI